MILLIIIAVLLIISFILLFSKISFFYIKKGVLSVKRFRYLGFTIEKNERSYIYWKGLKLREKQKKNEKQKEEKPDKKKGKKTKEKEKKSKKKRSINDIMAMWEERDFIFSTLKNILISLYKLIKCIKINKAELEIRLATPDPYITGLIYGYYQSAKFLLVKLFTKITVNTDFENEIPEINLELEISTRLYKIFFVIFWLIFHIRWIKLIKFIRKIKK
ncbi:DUF2953 domain-containing protein [bacterium]|nr:DUF2953 domain-containing protein [bacterium]